MAAVGWRAAVSWLLALATLIADGTSGSGDILWPEGVTDFELWQMISELEPAITGNTLRIADLAIRMVDMGDKKFTNAHQYARKSGYTDCKCRLDCLASSKCVAFDFKSGGTCRKYSKRGNTIGDNDADRNMQFKILDATLGDKCQIDLECSRRTFNSSCQVDFTTADNTTTCQCQGDDVPHNGACVDPMTLTTTVSTTTTITTTTEPTSTTAGAESSTSGTSTTDTTTVTTTTAAPVTDGSVSLEDMLMELEWPCDEDNTDPDACNFMNDFALGGQPPIWTATVAGQCDLDRGRCKFPAVVSTGADVLDPGAPRIEAWRSAGQFHFDMAADFPSPPADLTDPYEAGSSEPALPWKYDCSTTDGTSAVLTGFLGLARDDKFNKNIPRDMDLLLCTRFTEVFLQVDPSVGEVLDISANGEFLCPAGHVITGVWDSDKDFLVPKRAKCSRLASGTVEMGDPDCMMTGRHAASDTAIYWNACDQSAGPRVATGLLLRDVTDNAESKEWELRCCSATGPATSTVVE